MREFEQNTSFYHKQVKKKYKLNLIINHNKITLIRNLYDMRQAEIFESCLAYWKVILSFKMNFNKYLTFIIKD